MQKFAHGNNGNISFQKIIIMMNNTYNDEVYTSVSSLIDQLLKNYDLEENTDTMRDKIDKNIETNKSIIRHLAKNFAIGKFLEKDVLASLQKNLNLPPEMAQKIMQDIKNTLVPFIKKIEDSRPQDNGTIKKLPEEIKLPQKNMQKEKTKSNKTDTYREPIE